MTKAEEKINVGNRPAAARVACNAKMHAREVMEMLSEDANFEEMDDARTQEPIGGFLKEQALRKKIQAKMMAAKRKKDKERENDETENDDEEVVSKRKKNIKRKEEGRTKQRQSHKKKRRQKERMK